MRVRAGCRRRREPAVGDGSAEGGEARSGSDHDDRCGVVVTDTEGFPAGLDTGEHGISGAHGVQVAGAGAPVGAASRAGGRLEQGDHQVDVVRVVGRRGRDGVVPGPSRGQQVEQNWPGEGLAQGGVVLDEVQQGAVVGGLGLGQPGTSLFDHVPLPIAFCDCQRIPGRGSGKVFVTADHPGTAVGRSAGWEASGCVPLNCRTSYQTWPRLWWSRSLFPVTSWWSRPVPAQEFLTDGARCEPSATAGSRRRGAIYAKLWMEQYQHAA